MDISKLNWFNLLGLTKKVEKTEKTNLSSKGGVDSGFKSEAIVSGDDSVSISLEGSIKKITMESQEQLTGIREDKVKEIKDKLASGTYQVEPQDVARAILKGQRDIYEELK